MFKFVVVCALIVAAVAEPQVLFGSYGGLVSSPDYYPNAYSKVVYNSPLLEHATYSSPLVHLIKKRSASPIWPTYSAVSPLITGYSGIPYSSSFITSAHLIKKRSAAWPSGFSSLGASFYTPTIGDTSYISSPYFSSFIKK